MTHALGWVFAAAVVRGTPIFYTSTEDSLQAGSEKAMTVIYGSYDIHIGIFAAAVVGS